MNKMKKLAVAVVAMAAAAGLSGCATTWNEEASKIEAAPVAEPQKVSRPTQNYGSLGGYRYRRFVAVSAAAN